MCKLIETIFGSLGCIFDRDSVNVHPSTEITFVRLVINMHLSHGSNIEQEDSTATAAAPNFKLGKLPESVRMMLVKRFGSQTLSYSAATQTGLRHFGSQEGFIAYQSKFGYTFALSDPVADPGNFDSIISAFLEFFPRAAFVQVSDRVAEILAEKNFWINEMGVDTRLNLLNYDFRGKEKERFRYAANWLTRRNFSITELPFNDEVILQTKSLCQRWRSTRRVKQETAFINRPMEYWDQPDMRRFFLLDPKGQIAAFVFFDPIYENGNIIGYVTSFKRRDTNCPSMAELGICKIAIEKFRAEGKQVVKLGLSPLAEIDDGKFRHNWIMKRSFRFVHSAGWVNRYFYNVKGHAEFKNRFRGETEKTYFATQTFINDFRLFALMRLSKIL